MIGEETDEVSNISAVAESLKNKRFSAQEFMLKKYVPKI
jgi:hypothetical protein